MSFCGLTLRKSTFHARYIAIAKKSAERRF
jgi:hypothetical protein